MIKEMLYDYKNNLIDILMYVIYVVMTYIAIVLILTGFSTIIRPELIEVKGSNMFMSNSIDKLIPFFFIFIGIVFLTSNIFMLYFVSKYASNKKIKICGIFKAIGYRNNQIKVYFLKRELIKIFIMSISAAGISLLADKIIYNISFVKNGLSAVDSLDKLIWIVLSVLINTLGYEGFLLIHIDKQMQRNIVSMLKVEDV